MESLARGSIASLVKSVEMESAHTITTTIRWEGQSKLTFVANSIREFTTDTNTDNVSRREDKLLSDLLGLSIGFIDNLGNLVQGHGGDHVVVLDRGTI